ncbi:hypothetical protein HK096_006117 [Nowakowskiella sp. JEL0078]|nr:hypothetical protein HK096_006117 [Nowakowskiella sp. JEL0078]
MTETSSDFRFVAPTNPNLLCCICCSPFVSPVSAPCGHIFCRSCIVLYISNSPESGCPMDRLSISVEELVPASRVIENMVEELEVYCKYKMVGCEWIGQRQSLDSHLKKECSFETITCPKCGKEFTLLTLELHADSRDCSAENPVLGPEIECSWRKYGCSWRGVDENNHLQTCSYEAIKSFLQIQELRHQELQQQNTQMSAQIESLQAEIQVFQNSCFCNIPGHEFAVIPDGPVTVAIDRIGEDIEFLRVEMENMNASSAAIEVKQNLALMNESSRLREEIQSVKALCHAMQMQMIYLLERRKESPGQSSTTSVLSKGIGKTFQPSQGSYDRNTKL